jgi:hypothetical protein
LPSLTCPLLALTARGLHQIGDPPVNDPRSGLASQRIPTGPTVVQGPAVAAAAGGGRRRSRSFLSTPRSSGATRIAGSRGPHAHHMFVEMLPCRDSGRKNLGLNQISCYEKKGIHHVVGKVSASMPIWCRSMASLHCTRFVVTPFVLGTGPVIRGDICRGCVVMRCSCDHSWSSMCHLPGDALQIISCIRIRNQRVLILFICLTESWPLTPYLN